MIDLAYILSQFILKMLCFVLSFDTNFIIFLDESDAEDFDRGKESHETAGRPRRTRVNVRVCDAIAK